MQRSNCAAGFIMEISWKIMWKEVKFQHLLKNVVSIAVLSDNYLAAKKIIIIISLHCCINQLMASPIDLNVDVNGM